MFTTKFWTIIAQCTITISSLFFFFYGGAVTEDFRLKSEIVRECRLVTDASSNNCKDAAFAIAIMAPGTIRFFDATLRVQGIVGILGLGVLMVLVFGNLQAMKPTLPESESRE